MSLCPSVHPSTRSFFDFNDIWCVGRGRREWCMIRLVDDTSFMRTITGQCRITVCWCCTMYSPNLISSRPTSINFIVNNLSNGLIQISASLCKIFIFLHVFSFFQESISFVLIRFQFLVSCGRITLSYALNTYHTDAPNVADSPRIWSLCGTRNKIPGPQSPCFKVNKMFLTV